MTDNPPPVPGTNPPPQPCGPNPVSFKISVPAEHVNAAGGHESFAEKLKDVLKTVGIDAAEVVLFPLYIATAAKE